MFREMRRFKQQITTEECKKVLKEEKRAAFSVIGDEGYPYTIPINFYYDEADNIIYFHGAKEGHKADAVNRCDNLCREDFLDGLLEKFELDGKIYTIPKYFNILTYVGKSSVVGDKIGWTVEDVMAY